MAQSITSAFAVAPTSLAKSQLVTAFNSVITAIESGQSGGAYSAAVSAQLKDEVIDAAEICGANLRHWADDDNESSSSSSNSSSSSSPSSNSSSSSP